MTANPVVLRTAAAILRNNGWQQDSYGNQGGPRCIIGALKEAKWVAVDEQVSAEISWLQVLAGTRPMSYPDNIIAWNDDPTRTADDVITLLEQAAEKLEAEL